MRNVFFICISMILLTDLYFLFFLCVFLYSHNQLNQQNTISIRTINTFTYCQSVLFNRYDRTFFVVLFLFLFVFFLLLSFWFFFHHLTIGVLRTWRTFLCTALAQPDFRVQRILAIIPFANSVLHICGVRMRAHFGRYGEEKGHLIHFNRTESSIKGQLN